jgi:hypothetical protein
MQTASAILTQTSVQAPVLVSLLQQLLSARQMESAQVTVLHPPVTLSSSQRFVGSGAAQESTVTLARSTQSMSYCDSQHNELLAQTAAKHT